MSRKTYGQFCGLAHALDVVGERWTLLIVRELNTGPKRYTELAAALPGIGTSLLASRMRQLEADDVIERRLDPDSPGSTVVYALSESGRELADALVPLAIWGARHPMTGADPSQEVFRAEWLVGFLAADLRVWGPTDFTASFEFHIDDSVACLVADRGEVRVRPGPHDGDADATVHTSATTIAAIVAGKLSVSDAVAEGLLDLAGDGSAAAVLLQVVENRTGTPVDAG